MVALVFDKSEIKCGGTLVASKYVISAAHCMFTDKKLTKPRPVSEFKVREIIPTTRSVAAIGSYRGSC